MARPTTLRPSRADRRAANAILRTAADRYPELELPYYCECADETCRRAVWLTRTAYDARRRAGRSLLAPVHELALARAS